MERTSYTTKASWKVHAYNFLRWYVGQLAQRLQSVGYPLRRITQALDIDLHIAGSHNPQSGRPVSRKMSSDTVDGRIVMDDPSSALAACEAGQGLFQSFELGLAQRFASGKLVQVLPEWSDERFPIRHSAIQQARCSS